MTPLPEETTAPGKILVVEDDPDVAWIIALRLGEDGHEVRLVETGTEALSLLEEWTPDLAIIDVMMPGMSGLQLMELLHTTPGYRRLPVIIQSALATEDQRITGLRLGADDYLIKPFSIDELAARVMAVLRRTRGQPAEADTPEEQP